jgi:hypothetical protein
MKIRSSGAEFCPCGQTDRQADISKLIIAFSNFVNAPKNGHDHCTTTLPEEKGINANFKHFY